MSTNKILKILLSILVISLLTAGISSANTDHKSYFSEGQSVISETYNDARNLMNYNTENQEVDKLIKDIPLFFEKKQYEKFISLTAGDLNASLNDLLLGPYSKQYKKSNIGLWNITDLKIIKYKQVPNSQVPSGSVNYDNYSSYDDIVTYYVSADIVTREDNSDIFSGNNYYLWVLGKDNKGYYKLLQWSQPIIAEMRNSKLAYNDGTEELQNNIQNSRLHGIVLNGKGEMIKSSNISPLTLNDPNDCPIPSQIRVKRASTGTIQTVNFYSYVKNVLPNEWTASSDPIESLKTGAMCVKMYGWYRCYNYKYYGQGFDVYDDTRDQVYRPGSEHSRSTTAINNVSGQGIINSDWLLFETQYLDSGPTQNSGKVSQTGANNLANQGYSWYRICSYYYSSSNKSSGMIINFSY